MGCDDRRDNRVTVYTPTRRPTRRPTQHEHVSPHVRRDGRRDARRDRNGTVLKKIALPIAHVVALVWFGIDEMVCLKKPTLAIALVCFTLNPLTARAAYIRVLIFIWHIKYHRLNMLRIKDDINQQYLQTVKFHFVKSE